MIYMNMNYDSMNARASVRRIHDGVAKEIFVFPTLCTRTALRAFEMKSGEIHRTEPLAGIIHCHAIRKLAINSQVKFRMLSND